MVIEYILKNSKNQDLNKIWNTRISAWLVSYSTYIICIVYKYVYVYYMRNQTIEL